MNKKYEVAVNLQQDFTAAEQAQGRDNIGATASKAIAVDYADLTFPIAEGTQCFHDGGYFYANTDIATSEDWTAAHWTETSVAEQIGNVETLLAAL